MKKAILIWSKVQMSNAIKYIKASSQKKQIKHLGILNYSGVKVYIKDELPEEVNVSECLDFVFSKMPRFFYSKVDSIQIGKFINLQQRNLDALFENGVVYLSNEQKDDEYFISSIVHEIAHSFEESYGESLYDDKTIENEFLAKRDQMFRILEADNLIPKHISQQDFYNMNYDIKFDKFLYKEIGYEKLWYLLGNIFISPYAATSKREYFANAFECFFVHDIKEVEKISKNIYNKLIQYLEV